MKTIPITIDNNLMRDMERVVREMHTTRSAFVVDAIKQAIGRRETLKVKERTQQQTSAAPTDATAELDLWAGKSDDIVEAPRPLEESGPVA